MTFNSDRLIMAADASKFLAQSQSRLSFAPTNERPAGDGRGRRQQGSSNGWRLGASTRVNPQRAPNPYQPTSSQLSGFPFASRLNPQQAPLFYSTTDEFREANDEEEHERDIADFYALQRSRRNLGGSELKESSEAGEASTSSVGNSAHSAEQSRAGLGRPGGIRSSWRGNMATSQARKPQIDDVVESPESETDNPMVNIGLDSTYRSEPDDDPPDDLFENPPSIQMIRKGSQAEDDYESDEGGPHTGHERLLESDGLPFADEMPEMVPAHQGKPPIHDLFWAHIYLLNLAAMFTTWFIIYLKTDAPKRDERWGDTVYNTLRGSVHLLTVYTIISVFVSLIWLATLRAYVRPLVYTIIVAVPVVLFSFGLYPLIWSIKGSTVQDSVMRWGSFLPIAMAVLWVLAVGRGRLVMQKAIAILEFATRVLAANPPLVLVGFGTLASIIGFTWIWLAMFTRVFLGGHPDGRGKAIKFIIDTSTWWLGIYFIIIYLWSIAVIFGIQRTVTSATVSQWYFHRLAVSAPNPQTVVKAALRHSATTLFGTISLFTGLGLLVRLPLLILPKRLTMLLGIAMYSLIPTPIAVLINPLTLTYASVHSQPLRVSAGGLSRMHFLVPSDPRTALYPDAFNNKRATDGWSADAKPLMPYRLAKLLLHATRFMMSLALGFGGWVATARNASLANAGFRGSLYAYVVGLIAGAIGWSILGAMEGVLACIVDAIIICWGSEVGPNGSGEARYCREAGDLFSANEVVDQGRLGLV